ncbi:MAG: hypothetical protein ACXWV2_12485 [Chitinophagaceae bacterium]
MKNLGKFLVVACGLVMSMYATSTTTKAERAAVLPGEGCRGEGECGTTPAGTKLNGSYTVWPD